MTGDDRALLRGFMTRLTDDSALVAVADIVEVASLFRAHLALDDLPRAQLVRIADWILPQYAGTLNWLAPAPALRFNLRKWVQQCRVDDKDIYWEGIKNMGPEEHWEACATRGAM